jgi:hypothetical protein
MEKNADILEEMKSLGVVALEADGELTRDAAMAVLGIIRDLDNNRDWKSETDTITNLQNKKRQLTLDAINN